MAEKSAEKQITVYSTVWCPDCKRAKKFFGEQRIPYVNIDIEQDPEAMAYVEKVNHGMRVIPTILFPDGSILAEPSNAELARKLGLQTKAQRQFYDVIVIGGGPAEGRLPSIWRAKVMMCWWSRKQGWAGRLG
jgi:glutaredoxin-like protein